MAKPIPRESYWYWLRACALAAIPQANEWRGAWSDAVDLARSLAFAVGMTLVRLVILLTFPIGVPLLAVIAMRANHRAAAAQAKARDELIKSRHSLQTKDIP